MMLWNGHGMSAWGYSFMAISMLVFWGLVIAAGTMLVRQYRRSPHPVGHPRSPADILDGRFARGDIDHDEYASRHAALRTQS